MKRAVRWIGIGITVAAAATMLLADVALAAPVGRQPGTPVDIYVMRFDVLSPGGIDCAVDAPGSDVRKERDLVGHPLIRIWGNPRAATIICTDAQGVRWQATAQHSALYRRASTIYGTVLYRPDRAATMTIVDAAQWTEYQHKTFVRLD